MALNSGGYFSRIGKDKGLLEALSLPQAKPKRPFEPHPHLPAQDRNIKLTTTLSPHILIKHVRFTYTFHGAFVLRESLLRSKLTCQIVSNK